MQAETVPKAPWLLVFGTPFQLTGRSHLQNGQRSTGDLPKTTRPYILIDKFSPLAEVRVRDSHGALRRAYPEAAAQITSQRELQACSHLSFSASSLQGAEPPGLGERTVPMPEHEPEFDADAPEQWRALDVPNA